MNFETYKNSHTDKEVLAFKMGQDYGFTQAVFLLFANYKDVNGINLYYHLIHEQKTDTSTHPEMIDMVLNDIQPDQEVENLNRLKSLFNFLMLMAQADNQENVPLFAMVANQGGGDTNDE